MKQVNCSTSRSPNPLPFLVIDNGHQYPGVPDPVLPNRVTFSAPDTEIPWGFTIVFGTKSVRGWYIDSKGVRQDHFPDESGAFEGPLLEYGPPVSTLAPLHVDGVVMATPDGQSWTMNGHCDFVLHKRMIEGGEAVVDAILDGRGDSNCVSTLSMWHFGEHFYPNDYGPAYWNSIKPTARKLGSRGYRWCPILVADWQVLASVIGMSPQAWVDRWAREVAGEANVIPFLVNEFQKNGLDPLSVQKPTGTGCLWSRGSSTTDSPPPFPGWDIHQWEGRRDEKALFGAQDGYYVMQGRNEDGTVNDRPMPTCQTETMGFYSINVPGRRSNDPNLARIIGATTKVYMQGGLIMTEEALTSRPWEPRTVECVTAFRKAMTV